MFMYIFTIYTYISSTILHHSNLLAQRVQGGGEELKIANPQNKLTKSSNQVHLTTVQGEQINKIIGGPPTNELTKSSENLPGQPANKLTKSS